MQDTSLLSTSWTIVRKALLAEAETYDEILDVEELADNVEAWLGL